MKINLQSAVILLCLFITQHVKSQNLQGEIVVYPGPFEYNLGSPDFSEGTQIIPVGIDLWEGNEVNRIYYGRNPSGSSNKPVLVFVHGYASNAQVFFTGDDNMYADIYRDGYRSAYVSLTPNDDMWTNGFMLSTMIDQIKSHYNNAPLVLVGWSKGGVDIDAALVHFGANDQVDEVFTLSSPHLGTSIAELANSVLLSLVNIIFMQDNDATLSLQRGYMSYFRSITDGSPSNTVPYTTIGGWGNGPLNRLDIPQAILHGIDGPRANGGNDGVVPYNSSIRPGATELFDGQKKKYGLFGIPYYNGPSETNLDHFEVTRGGKVWPFIRNSLQSMNRQPIAPKAVANSSLSVTSRFQWIAANAHEHITISPGQHHVQLLLATGAPQALSVTDANGAKTKIAAARNEASSQPILSYDLSHYRAGTYQVNELESTGMLIEAGGPSMTLTVENPVFRMVDASLPGVTLSFDQTADQPLKITGSLCASIDLKSNRMLPKEIPLQITEDHGQYLLRVAASVKPGIYQLLIRAQGENFRRDLLTSVAITSDYQQEEDLVDHTSWTLYPNPANDELHVAIDREVKDAVITIYSLRGDVLYRQTQSSASDKIYLSSAKYPDGLYIVELQQDAEKTFKKLMIKR